MIFAVFGLKKCILLLDDSIAEKVNKVALDFKLRLMHQLLHCLISVYNKEGALGILVTNGLNGHVFIRV